MRVLRWFLIWFVSLAVCAPVLSGASTLTWTFHNDDSVQHSARVAFNLNGTFSGDPPGAGYTVAAGDTAVWSTDTTYNGTSIQYLFWWDGSPSSTNGAHGLQTYECVGGGNDTYSGHNYYSGAAPAPTTNSYCFYHVQWENDSEKFAQLYAFIDAPSGPLWPTGMVARVVSPGQTADFWLTNWIGTNLTCYSLVVGDGRENSTATDGTFTGTKVSSTTSYTNDNSGLGSISVGNPSSPPGVSPSSGSTNGATGQDLATLRDFMGEGFKYVGNEIAEASVLNSSNHFRLRSEVGGVGTNTLAAAGALGNITNRLGLGDQAATNALEFSETNTAWASNAVADSALASEFNGALALANGLSDVADGFAEKSWSHLDTFGKMTVDVGGQSLTIDMKKALALDTTYLPSEVATFKAWLRVAIIWGVLLTAIFLFVQNLRASIKDCLSVPAAGTGASAGGLSLVPGVDLTMRTVGVLALLVGVAFLPAECVAVASTMLSGIGVSVSGSVAGMLGVPDSFVSVVSVAESWLPFIEVFLICLHWGVLELFLHGITVFFLGYVKAVQVPF